MLVVDSDPPARAGGSPAYTAFSASQPTYPSRKPTVPLLPYANRQTPLKAITRLAESTGGRGAAGSWTICRPFGQLLWPRGRLRAVTVLAGVALIFLLHSYYFGPLLPPLESLQLLSPAHERPFSVLDTSASVGSTIKEHAKLDTPSSKYIQKRRETPPTWPDPWKDSKGADWKGREWLSVERFPAPTEQDVAAGLRREGMRDPEEAQDPPSAYIAKAFEYAAAAARGKRGKSGRPTAVAHADMFLGKSQPPLRVADVENGRLGEILPKFQWAGFSDLDRETGPGDRDRVVEESRRREWVRRAFQHVWEGYKKHAWGHDELKPVSAGYSDGYNGWGATIFDSLDVLLIMNLTHEYNVAREHIAAVDFTYLLPRESRASSTVLPALEDLDLARPRLARRQGMNSPTAIPTFETTIRYLGGLLSAYDLSHDPLMLARAQELGDWILPALGTKHGLAVGHYTFGDNLNGREEGSVSLAEAGSMSMEFTRLSMVTGDEIYHRAVQRSTDTFDKGFDRDATGRLGTLLPVTVNPANPKQLQGEYTFGAMADSMYEYLIKLHQLLGGAQPQLGRMYAEAIDSAHKYLIKPVEVIPGRADLILIGSMNFGGFSPRLQHLTCFAGGMLALGAKLLGRAHLDMETAVGVTETCAWMYESTETGLGSEWITFYPPDETSRWIVETNRDGSETRVPRGSPAGVQNADRRSLSRPETIESVFYMWRMTGDRKWQDRGWQMFTSWVEHAMTESGFANLRNVNYARGGQEDSMESFVLGETFKYYFLLFSPHDLISLDEWVFNTEAHPFRLPNNKKSGDVRTFWGTTGSLRTNPVTGEGTPVQLWARVQQAATFAHTLVV